MSYQSANRYPEYKTIYVKSKYRPNPLSQQLTGKFVYEVDHSAKSQKVFEVVSIDKYVSRILGSHNFIEELYDSNGKIWKKSKSVQ